MGLMIRTGLKLGTNPVPLGRAERVFLNSEKERVGGTFPHPFFFWSFFCIDDMSKTKKNVSRKKSMATPRMWGPQNQ